MASSSTPVKWVASDHDGLPMKRKQVAQACETCRKRKKRCIHTESLVDGPAANSRPGTAAADDPASQKPLPPHSHDGSFLHRRQRSPRQLHQRQQQQSQNAAPADEEDATQVAANRLMELSSSRFISDLNPEGMFIQAATPALPAGGTTYRDKNDLGVWLPPYSQAQGDDDGGGSSGDGDDDGVANDDGNGDDRHSVGGANARNGKSDFGQFGGANGGGGGNSSGHANGTVGDNSHNSHHHKQRRRSRKPNATSSGRSAISEAALLYERAKYIFVKECLTICPPDADFAVLHRIYCEKVHPLLPVLKDADLQRASTAPFSSSSSDSPLKTPPPHSPLLPLLLQHPQQPPQSSLTASIFPTVVKQIIALSAAITDGEAAAPHLRLEPNGPLLTPREFHHRLTDAVSTILDADMIAHRFDYIRATILLSFFYQPSTEADRNKPSFLCTQATYHFQTIGAHLLGYRPEQPDDDVERTFCALWALDRLASVLYARPCMMHANDNGKNPEDCIANQPPCFRLFMSVILWLDKVINLYRPRQPFVMIDIPVYEALILDAQAERLPAMLLGTIEILYHTVCVLSCRQPLSAFSDASPQNRDDRTYLPISIMNPRRSHSADRIVWVTQTQPICLFPYVPYAVSIALSVQYKKMRYSRTPLFRTRARIGFKDIVSLLCSMGDVFMNARVNAALGESIWRQMEKTATTLAREELEGGAPAPEAPVAVVDKSATAHTDGSRHGHAPIDDSKTAGAPTDTAESAPASVPASVPAFVSSSVSASAPTPAPAPAPGPAPTPASVPAAADVPQTRQSGQEYISAASTTNTMQPQLQPGVDGAGPGVTVGDARGAPPLPLSSQSPSHPPPPPSSQPSQLPPLSSQQQQQQQPISLLDLSVLDTLDTDIDLFGNFDPSFDLGAIDTALEANLDMAIPQNWTLWNNHM